MCAELRPSLLSNPPPAVGRLWHLQLLFDRWALAVEVLQGQRNTEIRCYILLRASWAAWRAHHRHVSAKADLTHRGTAVIARLRRQAVLKVWRGVAAELRASRRREDVVVEWGRRKRLTDALLGGSTYTNKHTQMLVAYQGSTPQLWNHTHAGHGCEAHRLSLPATR